jgi:amino acid adenylation domain-containing protein
MTTFFSIPATQAQNESRNSLVGQNSTTTDYPRHSCIHEVFEHEAARRPKAVAVRFGDQHLTYRELNERANQLARKLRDLGVGPEVMVGTLIERSLEMVIGLLGILKAGGAFVPMDLSYPKERLAFMAADTKSPVLVVHAETMRAASTESWSDARLVDLNNAELNDYRKDNLENLSGPESLAYVMYTSGSTGCPKGVMVPHRAVVRLVRNTNYLEFGETEVFLQFSPISFDASTLEIWGPLLNGGCVAVAPPRTQSLEEIGATIRRLGVTTAWFTAGLFNLMVDQRIDDLKPLRQLLAGGDALSVSHVRKAFEALPDCRLVNGYGPTEGTTFSCCHTITRADTLGTSIPIGRPISNTRVYVLNSRGELAGVGEEGELYVAGDGLARGYLNQPEMTTERFLTAQVADVPERLYKTGDLVRSRCDGAVEFLGRIDDQVKISGYRIEPGEIEACLKEHPEVRDAAVIARRLGAGEKKLYGYVVLHDRTRSGTSLPDLLSFVKNKLPAYMVPTQLLSIDSLPLSVNGKVDRAALPTPKAADQDKSSVASATKSELEEKIAHIWCSILGLKEVGLDQNFFDIGGDSLQILEVHSELKTKVSPAVQVTDLFEYTTIRALAQKLSASTERAFDMAQQRARQQHAAWSRQKAIRNS